GAEVAHETTSIGGLELTFEVIEPGHFFLQVATPKLWPSRVTDARPRDSMSHAPLPSSRSPLRRGRGRGRMWRDSFVAVVVRCGHGNPGNPGPFDGRPDDAAIDDSR